MMTVRYLLTAHHLANYILSKVVHVLRLGEPICPKCGQGLESEGGSVVPRGSWDWGPLWWECEDDGEQWGHA
jgi:hypothetical protein